MARYGTCPECFAGLLSADPDTTVSTMQVLKNDWKILRFPEQSGNLKCILSDLQFLFSMPVRLACSLFEQSGWISSDATALSILAAVVKILPDNKIVEDAHQAVRVEAKANPNQRMAIKTIQSTVMNSRIFSSRQLSHPAKLSKDGFFRKWGKKVPQHLSRKSFYPKFHRLPEVFGNIFKKKTWMTLSEEQYGKSYAAWHWIRHFSNCHLSCSGYLVEDTCHGHSNCVMCSLSLNCYIHHWSVFQYLHFFSYVLCHIKGWSEQCHLSSWSSSPACCGGQNWLVSWT